MVKCYRLGATILQKRGTLSHTNNNRPRGKLTGQIPGSGKVEGLVFPSPKKRLMIMYIAQESMGLVLDEGESVAVYSWGGGCTRFMRRNNQDQSARCNSVLRGLAASASRQYDIRLLTQSVSAVFQGDEGNEITVQLELRPARTPTKSHSAVPARNRQCRPS